MSLTYKKIRISAQKVDSYLMGKQSRIPTNVRNKTRITIIITTFEHYTVGLSQLTQTKERTEKYKIAKQEVKLPYLYL